MAVTLISELPDGGEGAWNRMYQRTYARVFRVECDSRTDGPVTIRTAGSVGGVTLPSMGNSYFVKSTEKDLGSFVSDVSYRREHGQNHNDRCSWLVAYTYTPYDALTFGQNPVDWPTKLTIAGQRYDRAAVQDKDGNQIKNSAGDPFGDPISIDDTRTMITVERNELISTFSLPLLEAYRDTVNAASWNGFAARTVKCGMITAGPVQYDSNNNVYYWTVVYPFEVNRDTWDKVILDQGYTDISLVDATKRLTIRGTDGQPLTDPSPLNGSGHRLAVGGSPVFLTFRVYPETDFTAFNIDFSHCLGR